MRKFIVTINGNDYEVGVEEIGADERVVNTIGSRTRSGCPRAAGGARCGGKR